MQGFTIRLRNMIKGTYIFYENGKEIYRSPNLITKFGKRFLTNVIAGNVNNQLKDIAIGIDSTAATVDDTRLGFEFYRTPVILSSTDIQTTDGTTTYSVVYKCTIPQDISGVISEVGLYPQTRSSLNNYDSKFISDFSNYLNWTNSSGVNPDTLASNAKIGSDVIQMPSGLSGASKEYTTSISPIDISGYSVQDSIRLAYYRNDTNLDYITIKFYSSDTDYYSVNVTPTSGVGYKISSNIMLNTLFTDPTGSPDKTQINKIGIVIKPTTGNTTTVGLDGLRINDEDTFDPIFGLISRSVLGTALTKLAGRQVDIEYKLDLSF
jgi:hypothetical protein